MYTSWKIVDTLKKKNIFTKHFNHYLVIIVSGTMNRQAQDDQPLVVCICLVKQQEETFMNIYTHTTVN